MVSHIFTSSHNSLFFHPQVYPYLVVNDACLTESRREERVLQLLRMMNHFLTKQKETLRRLLYFTVPRVVAISPQMRLVEDNPASVSLLDVYKQVSNHNFPLTSPPPFMEISNIGPCWMSTKSFPFPFGTNFKLRPYLISLNRLVIQFPLYFSTLLKKFLSKKIVG